MENNILQQLDLGRVFVPDAAHYWSALYSGFSNAQLFNLIHAIGYVLLVVGFVLALYNALLSQNFNAMGGVLLRLALAAVFIGGWPNIRGTDPQTGYAWQMYHTIYAATYGSKNCNPTTTKPCPSFYNTWVRPQVASTFKDIRVALVKLFSLQVSTAALSGVTSALSQLINNPIVKTATTVLDKTPKPPAAIAATVTAGVAFSAVRGITDEVNRLLAQVKDQISAAMRNLLIVFLVLAGLHALIVYGTITILALAVFFLPIFTGLWLFRGLDRGFPTVLGTLLATLVALPVSAIMTGVMAVMVFGVTKERVQQWLPTTTEIEEQQKKLMEYNRLLPTVQREVLSKANEMEKNSKALKGVVDIWNNRCGEGLETACNDNSRLSETSLSNLVPPGITLYKIVEQSRSVTLSNGTTQTITIPWVEKEEELTALDDASRQYLLDKASQLEIRAAEIMGEWQTSVNLKIGSLIDNVFNYITNQIIKIGLGLLILTMVTLIMTGIMTALTIFAVSRVIMLTSDFNIGTAINPGVIPMR